MTGRTLSELACGLARISAAVVVLSVPAQAHAAKVVKIAAADAHTCALFDNGGVKCWGGNGSGQLGLGNTTSRGNTAGSMGAALPYVNLGAGAKVIDIKANGEFSCALLDTQQLKCWGENGSGQLGQGDTNTRGDAANEMGDQLKPIDFGNGRTVKSFALGFDFACAILDNRALKCWGANNGSLAIGDNKSRGSKPGEMGDALPAAKLGLNRYAVQVSCGYGHTCVLLDNGATKCFGDGSSGQLGQGDTVTRGTTVATVGDLVPAIDLGTSMKVTKVVAASTHSCAQFEDSSVKCWGDNSDGGVGSGAGDSPGDQAGEMGTKLPFVELEPGLQAQDISCARRHCCVVFAASGTVKCWGANADGQLGLGDTVNRGNQSGQMGIDLPFIDLGRFQSASSVYTSRYHSCVILTDGGVKCWGENADGQLGLGDTQSRGDQIGEMGDTLKRIVLE